MNVAGMVCASTDVETVRRIVAERLANSKYGGLFHSSGCACSKDNLCHCGTVHPECSIGVLRLAIVDPGKYTQAGDTFGFVPDKE